MENYVITVARGFGSGGRTIASGLADRLGIPWYENRILNSGFVGIDGCIDLIEYYVKKKFG